MNLSKLKAFPENLFTNANFRLFQTERVSDDNFDFDENGRMISKRVEKKCGKRGNSSFSTVFSKDTADIKKRACFRKV